MERDHRGDDKEGFQVEAAKVFKEAEDAQRNRLATEHAEMKALLEQLLRVRLSSRGLNELSINLAEVEIDALALLAKIGR